MLRAFTETLREDINEALDRGREKLSNEQLRAMINRALTRCNLVTREEFDAQAKLVASLEQRVAGLEARVTIMERERSGNPPQVGDIQL